MRCELAKVSGDTVSLDAAWGHLGNREAKIGLASGTVRKPTRRAGLRPAGAAGSLLEASSLPLWPHFGPQPPKDLS